MKQPDFKSITDASSKAPKVLFTAEPSGKYFLKVRSDRWIDVFEKRIRKRVRIIDGGILFSGAECWQAEVAGKKCDAVCVGLRDRSHMIYDAATGELIDTLPDPSEDPGIKAHFAQLSKASKRPRIYYVVMLKVNDRFFAFYDIHTASLDWNNWINESCLFCDKQAAEAVAAVLTEQRKLDGPRRVDGTWRVKPLQVAAVTKEPSRYWFMAETSRGMRRFSKTSHSRYFSFSPSLIPPRISEY